MAWDDTPPTKAELNSWDALPPTPQELGQTSTAQYISTIAKPILQGGGAVGGGIAGAAVGGPFGAAGGGVLGYGLGNEGANLLDQYLGLKKPIKDLKEAAKQMGQSLYGGAVNEAVGQVLGPVLKLAGKGYKEVASTMSGVPTKDFESLADNPAIISPSFQTNANKNLSKAREAFGVEQTGPAAEEAAVDMALRKGQERPYVDSLRQKIKQGVDLTPREIVEGNQAINTLLKNEKNPAAKRGFTLLKNKFESMMTPEIVSTNQEYSMAKSGSNFRKVLPITKSGDPAIVRTLYMLSKLAGPQALLSIPAANALPTIAGGFASRMSNNPIMRRAIVPPLLQALQNLLPQAQSNGNQ